MYRWLYRNLLSKMDPEKAHDLVVWGMEKFPYSRFVGKTFSGKVPSSKRLNVKVAGIDFPNPIGVSAGLDKKGTIFPNLLELGFSFVEVGTITLQSREGNQKPRIWRGEGGTLYNHMGLPNLGFSQTMRNVWELKNPNDIVGISISPTDGNTFKNGEELSAMVNYLYGEIDYITLNLSCPNVNNNYDIEKILNVITETSNFIKRYRKKETPIFVKSGPIQDKDNFKRYIELLIKHKISGIVLVNTFPTNLLIDGKSIKCGMSGPRLLKYGLDAVSFVYNFTNGEFPIIGVGGIENDNDVFNYIEAGASLVQLYTGLVNWGPKFPSVILREMLYWLEKEDKNIEDYKGIRA